MQIRNVNASHFGLTEEPSHPQVLLREAFVGAFSDPLQGSVAFSKVIHANIHDQSDEAQWIAGMNSIINQWNAMSSYSEPVIQQTFKV
jgi:hypothetical protein